MDEGQCRTEDLSVVTLIAISKIQKVTGMRCPCVPAVGRMLALRFFLQPSIIDRTLPVIFFLFYSKYNLKNPFRF